jgi:hypothetical protein
VRHLGCEFPINPDVLLIKHFARLKARLLKHAARATIAVRYEGIVCQRRRFNHFKTMFRQVTDGKPQQRRGHSPALIFLVHHKAQNASHSFGGRRKQYKVRGFVRSHPADYTVANLGYVALHHSSIDAVAGANPVERLLGLGFGIFGRGIEIKLAVATLPLRLGLESRAIHEFQKRLSFARCEPPNLKLSQLPVLALRAHGTGGLALVLLFLQGLTLVVFALTAGQGNLNLRAAILEVEAERNQSQTALL